MLTRDFVLATVAVCATVFTFPGRGDAQEPIIRLNVKPTKVAFGKWSQPTVLRTAEEAAKHFGEKPLEGVDFKKQIVLLFAWQGSGGDKLEYVVAESFPEQIMFSMKPGLTRDLRQHVHVFALRSNVKWSIKGVKAVGGGGDSKASEVRHLVFAPKDPTIALIIGGMNKVTSLTDAEAVEKLLGKNNAKALIASVDFDKEQLVLVSWSTSGPPDGVLRHEMKGDAKDRKVTFYVQGPPGGGVRGQRLRLGADFFAVPRSVTVVYDSKER